MEAWQVRILPQLSLSDFESKKSQEWGLQSRAQWQILDSFITAFKLYTLTYAWLCIVMNIYASNLFWKHFIQHVVPYCVASVCSLQLVFYIAWCFPVSCMLLWNHWALENPNTSDWKSPMKHGAVSGHRSPLRFGGRSNMIQHDPTCRFRSDASKNGLIIAPPCFRLLVNAFSCALQ